MLYRFIGGVLRNRSCRQILVESNRIFLVNSLFKRLKWFQRVLDRFASTNLYGSATQCGYEQRAICAISVGRRQMHLQKLTAATLQRLKLLY